MLRRSRQYLYDLGVSHVYSSPYLQAAPDSMHGYDVVDHQRVNEELGGAAAHERFSKTLGENGLGQVLDIVPNHMAIGGKNRFWWDVLENGAIEPLCVVLRYRLEPGQEERLRDKVLVPDAWGISMGECWSSGGINGAAFGVAVSWSEAGGQKLPAAPTSLPAIWRRPRCMRSLIRLSFVAASFGRLPSAFV